MRIILHKATDAELIRRIQSATRSLAIYAPGVSKPVAEALCIALRKFRGNVKVALDVSVKSVEMGFLDKDAARMIWHAQCEDTQAPFAFFNVPGLRLATLHVDDRAFVFAPAAVLMEDGNKSLCQNCPNGIELETGGVAESGFLDDMATVPVSAEDVRRLYESLDTVDTRPLSQRISAARDEGRGEERQKAAEEVRIAKEEKTAAEESARKAKEEARSAREETKAAQEEAKKVRDELQAEQKTVERLQKDVKVAGEKAVEAYKDRIKLLRLVKFNVKGAPGKIGTHQVQIPSCFLVGIPDKLRRQIKTTFHPCPADSELEEFLKQRNLSLAISHEKPLQAVRELVFDIKGYGRFVRKCDKEEFNRRIVELKKECERLQGVIMTFLKESMEKSLKFLFDTLYPEWEKQSHPWWEYYQPRTNEDRFKCFLRVMKEIGKIDVEMIGDRFKPDIEWQMEPLMDSPMCYEEKFRKDLKTELERKSRRAWERNTPWICTSVEDLLGPIPPLKQEQLPLC